MAEQKLLALGLKTLADIATTPLLTLRKRSEAGQSLQRSCRSQGGHELGRERPAFQEFDPRGGTLGTISNEQTFGEDVRDPARLEAMLCSLCERVCWRARRRGVKARTVSLKLRYADFETRLRSRTITATNSELELYPVVLGLLRRAEQANRGLWRASVCLSGLRRAAHQLSLFEAREPVHRAMEGVRERYGYDALRISHGASRQR